MEVLLCNYQLPNKMKSKKISTLLEQFQNPIVKSGDKINTPYIYIDDCELIVCYLIIQDYYPLFKKGSSRCMRILIYTNLSCHDIAEIQLMLSLSTNQSIKKGGFVI